MKKSRLRISPTYRTRKWILLENISLSKRHHANVAQRCSQIVYPRRLAKLDLMDKPERKFNMDEKGVQWNFHMSPIVLARIETKRVPNNAP
ncbi:hypothetical protein PR048_013737 [Dryococelus australis]|uniref:Uncharacterized protein n=1 Tax=Dryococelus australis TaxID=614101 RepID=A0ABQ9HT04_9NEOP|nr:hypothetical protein PR048_013737 [Dryococelus australis]